MELLNLYHKINLMKNTIFLFSLLFSLISCGVKVPYTNELRDQFSLDSDEKMRNVQFSISHTIILDQELESDRQNTTTNGTLISSSNTKKESIIIPVGTKCVFDQFGTKGEIIVRFELGDEKVLVFLPKVEGTKNRRYYFQADWSAEGGPKVNYGGNVFKVNLIRGFARSAHLIVVKKNLQKTKRKDRVVRGLKV
jgi:hypothetical protein